ncbi:pseudouridine synthase [Salinibius halmophilus]|uniref:pseudouridine synthase n=1 Tax=Salinibius halmophilus TaxID=1853216 RepID=UPI000E66B63C|nr:pseudouridine synthase [Salinibius halmophilus]
MTTKTSKPVEILFEDQHYLIANKPAGLFVHPSPMDPKVTDTLITRLGKGLRAVNRLDRPTTGPVVLAKSAEAARDMQAIWHLPSTEKVYDCFARGWMMDKLCLDYPLKYARDDAEFDRLNSPVQAAQTSFVPLAHISLPISVGQFPEARYSRIECRLHTGRKHQIRRHLKHLLHPIVGDTRYGEGRHNRLFRDNFHWQDLALRCKRLTFEHPYSQERVDIVVDLPDNWAYLLRQWQALGAKVMPVWP